MKNEKKKRAIRYSAFVIAAILAIGSFSVWAMNTQATATADVTIDDTPAGLNVESASPGALIDGGMFGRPDSLESPDLFTVEQPSENDYDGQYEVTVYVTNADELVDDFRYMNIDLTAELDDGETADIGYITLENGRVSFAVDSGDITGTTMTVSVEGGSYQATSGNLNGGVNFLIDVEEGSTLTSVTFD